MAFGMFIAILMTGIFPEARAEPVVLRPLCEYLKRTDVEVITEVPSGEHNSMFFESWREGVTEGYGRSAAS
jgi:hypothetical protein